MRKFKIILIGAIAAGGMATSLGIRHRAQVKLRENDLVLQQLANELAEVAAEHERLSNLVAHANRSPAEDRSTELEKLRSEAAALRNEINELGKRAENRPPRPPQSPWTWFTSWGLQGAGLQANFTVVTDSSSEEYMRQLHKMASSENNMKLDTARNLGAALRDYAREQGGEFPSTVDQAAPYLRKGHESLVGSKEFEMVYQGSLNELTNVLLKAVALVRDRQAWPTPGGKWARVYVMADGSPIIVESGDNFQSWEAAHIIPPPSAGQ